MDALCPSCKESTGAVVEKEVMDSGGLSVSFECHGCDEQWDVVF